MRGHIIKSFARFNGVIEIDKAVQGGLAMSAAGLHLFFMPHFHKGADNPFSLTIGLRAINTGEFLSNAMLFAWF